MLPFKANDVEGRELSIDTGVIMAVMSNTSLSYHRMIDDFSYLSPKRILNMARKIAVIPTDHKTSLYWVVCVGENEAWVSGHSKFITRVDLHGSVK